MTMVKRTFTLPENVSETLDATIPNQKRSQFIAKVLSDAFKDKQKQELIELLDGIEPWQGVQESAVDLIRRVRERRSNYKVADE